MAAVLVRMSAKATNLTNKKMCGNLVVDLWKKAKDDKEDPPQHQKPNEDVCRAIASECLRL
jgi:hypothetical protein